MNISINILRIKYCLIPLLSILFICSFAQNTSYVVVHLEGNVRTSKGRVVKNCDQLSKKEIIVMEASSYLAVIDYSGRILEYNGKQVIDLNQTSTPIERKNTLVRELVERLYQTDTVGAVYSYPQFQIEKIYPIGDEVIFTGNQACLKFINRDKKESSYTFRLEDTMGKVVYEKSFDGENISISISEIVNDKKVKLIGYVANSSKVNSKEYIITIDPSMKGDYLGSCNDGSSVRTLVIASYLERLGYFKEAETHYIKASEQNSYFKMFHINFTKRAHWYLRK